MFAKKETAPQNAVDKEDQEADLQFAKIEEYIDGKHTKKREEKQEFKRVQKIKQNLDKGEFKRDFGHLKDSMKDMSREDWESLPDAPDLVKISRKRRNQEY